MYDKNADWMIQNWWFVKLHVRYLVNFQIISLYIKTKTTELVITLLIITIYNSGKYISNIWATIVKLWLTKCLMLEMSAMAMAMPVNYFYQIEAAK